MTTFAELIMTPDEIKNWREGLSETNRMITRDYLAEIAAENDRINREIDACWNERNTEQ